MFSFFLFNGFSIVFHINTFFIYFLILTYYLVEEFVIAGSKIKKIML